MLKFINNNITIQWILVIFLVAFSLFTIFTKSQFANIEKNAFIFISFSNLFTQHIILGKILLVIILLLQIFLLQYFFRKNDFISKFSLLPSCFYLSILLLTKSLAIISPFFFTLLFFLIIISTNYTAPSAQLKNNAFWVGMMIALGTAFDTSSIILLLLAIITLIINHFSKMKEVGILIFGFSLVYLYFFSYHFFMNNLNEWLISFQQIQILEILNKKNFMHPITIISLIVLGITYSYFIIRTKLISDSKVVLVRKKVVSLNTWALMLIVCVFLSNSSYPRCLGYLFVPISIYLTMLAQERNPLYINELVTFITLLTIWL